MRNYFLAISILSSLSAFSGGQDGGPIDSVHLNCLSDACHLPGKLHDHDQDPCSDLYSLEGLSNSEFVENYPNTWAACQETDI